MMRTLSALCAAVLLTSCAAGGHGAAGIGDSYFPGLGNGGYDVQHYELSLRVDPRSNHLEGTALLDVLATQELRSFHLDLWQLTVASVEVDGVEAEFEHEGLELIVTPERPLLAGAQFVVSVVYGGEPRPVPTTSMPMGDGMGWMHFGDNVYVMSEPNGAPSFVPCNDHPLDKASWSVRVEVPSPWVAVSNGVPEPMVESDGWRRYVWNANDPMATYLLTLAIAPFELEETRLGPDFVLRNYWLPEQAEQARAGLARTAEILEYYSASFGPYPFESYGAIVTDVPFPGALETQTIPIYGRSAATEEVMSHELAHQWFGNCISVGDWSDIWLNEGFATYASWLWEGHAHGPDTLQQRLDKMSAMIASGRVGAPADPGAEDLFSAGVYVGGAWALYELHQAVGDETFFEIMRAWVERFHNGNASTDDFVELACEVSGSDQRPLLERWLYKSEQATADA